MHPITENIIRDLQVMVEAGEASDDTRVLVAEYLARNPDRAMKERSALPPVALLDVEAGERRALLRTRRLLGLRTWSMALALFFTALPLSFAGGNGGFRWLFLSGSPGLAAGSLVIGMLLWIAHIQVARRLRPSGL